PTDVVVIERTEWGLLIGTIKDVREAGRAVATGPAQGGAELARRLPDAAKARREIRAIETGEVGAINSAQESIRLALRRLEKRGQGQSSEARRLEAEAGALQTRYQERAAKLGVLAAFYLREYARQGTFVSAVRIAVNNLAGVPSIVFGVFGVGFFIYLVGGSIDRIFFSESLPTPTFGTGGILWASLTLALLTVPVVIVATEEGLAAIPRGTREASLALGAPKLEATPRV